MYGIRCRLRSKPANNLQSEMDRFDLLPAGVRDEAKRALLRARGLVRGTFREVTLLDRGLLPISDGKVSVSIGADMRIDGLNIAEAAELVRMLR